MCRKWFRADPRAVTQKVCSPACRLVWRGERAKVRRARDLEGHRQAERVRQNDWRALHPATTGPPATPSRRVTLPAPAEAPSRAGFAAQPSVTTEEILLVWDKVARLSRAGFELDLARILVEMAPNLGQVGQESAVCHEPGG